MKRIKISVLVGTMLVLCAALSMGCLQEETDIDELARLNAIENRTWQEEQRWNELRFEILYPSEGEGVSTEVPTFVPLSERDVAKYNFEWFTTDYIGKYSEAPSGYTYAIVTYRIKNDGYNTISTSPSFWKFSANGIVFDHDSKSYSDSVSTINVDVYNGGDITDTIVYLIPDNVDSAAFYYNPWYGDDTIYRDLTLEVEDFEWK